MLLGMVSQATGPLCNCLWYFPSKTRLVAGKPHARCWLGGNNHIILCRSHGLSELPPFRLPSQADAFKAPSHSTNSPPSAPGPEGQWGGQGGTSASVGLGLARAQQLPNGVRYPNSSPEQTKEAGTSWESADLNPIASSKVELIGAACTHRSEAGQTKEPSICRSIRVTCCLEASAQGLAGDLCPPGKC